MPKYTPADIEDAFNQGLINEKEKRFLRTKVFQDANEEEGLTRKLVTKLSHEVTEGWKKIREGGAAANAAAKENKGVVEQAKGNIDVVAGALQILSSLSTTGGNLAGENVHDYLVKKGANPSVAAAAAAVSDAVVQVFGGAVAYKGAKALKGVATTAAKATGAAAATAKAGAEAVPTSEQVTKAIGEWITEKQNPKNLVDVIRPGQDVKLSAGGGVMQGKRKALPPPPDTEKAGKLIDEAVQSGEPLDLAAMNQAISAPNPQQAITQGLHASKQATGAVKQLDKMAAPPVRGVMRGGLDTSSNVDAISRARTKFAEGEAKYEASRINLKDLQAEAQASPTPMSINDVLNLKPGEAKNPHEIVQLSKPMREFGQNFVKGVNEAEAGVAKGDYSKFWEMQNDFNLMVESHWPYMSPRQVAGQSTKVYDEPTLSVTRFLQQIPAYSSWMAKLKLNTLDEVEAAAPLIIKEWKKIKSPEEISNFAKTTAEQMADKGDEVFKDPTWRDKAYYYFVNSLMSGTDTIGRNISGNTLAVPWYYAEKQTSVAASKVINPFLSAEHKLDAGNFSDANAGLAIWFRTMWDSSKYVFKRQFDEIKGLVPNESAYSELFGNRFDLAKFSNTGTTNPFGGMTGKIIGTPVSIAQTSDEISRIAAYKLEVGAQLHKEWASGERNIPWRQYMDEGFANPPPSIHAQGIRVANELTFSDPMSAMGKTVMAARRNLPGFEFVAPFVHTADRLTAFGYNRTPGLSMLSTRLMDDMRSGDSIRQAEAIGRVTLSMIAGSGIFAATKTNAPDGLPLITGGGPTDRNLTMKMKNANIYQPYTIWTPAGRYSYGNLQPARLPIGMVADASEIWDEIKNPNDGTALWSGISLALTRNIFDVTYTKQIADLMDMWDKPSGSANFLQKFGANLIKGFVEPSIVRQMYHAAADPYVRETNGFMDELKKDIWAYGLPARVNPITREPVMNPPRMLADVPGLGWVLPTSPIQPRNDKTAQTLRDLQHMPPDFPHTLGGNTPSESPFGAGSLQEARDAAAGPKLDDKYRQEGRDYSAGKEGFDQTLSEEVDALIADPEFSKQAPLVQRDQINSIYHSRDKQSVEMLKDKYPELQDAWEQKVIQRQQVRLPPEERDAFEQTYNAPPDVEPPPDFNVLPTEEPAP